MNAYSNTYFFLQSVWSALTCITFLLVHGIFALAVLADAVKIEFAGKKTIFVGSKMWGFAVFCGGALTAIAYWLMHHSTLRSCALPESDEENTKAPVNSNPPY